MDAPLAYYPGFIKNSGEAFHTLWNELDWLRVAPRREYYCHDTNKPYTYGSGRGERTYQAQPYHPLLRAHREQLEDFLGVSMEVLFLNGYENSRDHLGNHSDVSDPKKPIAVITLGAEREIWVTRKDEVKDPSKRIALKLESGSLLLMLPGMQEDWFHRIPKASYECGPRISETFRGDVEVGLASA